MTRHAGDPEFPQQDVQTHGDHASASAEPLERSAGSRPLPREAEQQVEWENDLLVQLVARHIARGHTAPDYTDPRLLAWLVTQERKYGRARDQWSERTIASVAAAVRARVLAARVGIQLARTAAVVDPAPAAGTVENAIALGAARHAAPYFDLAIAAGEGRDVWDQLSDGWIQLPSAIPRGRYVALRVAGDSMVPLLLDGDTVLVRLGADVRRDTVVVAWRPDDGYVVKRVGRVEAHWLELLSFNAAYVPIRLEREPRSVLGTVVLRWPGRPPA